MFSETLWYPSRSVPENVVRSITFLYPCPKPVSKALENSKWLLVKWLTLFHAIHEICYLLNGLLSVFFPTDPSFGIVKLLKFQLWKLQKLLSDSLPVC
jgi:hypothetical protein